MELYSIVSFFLIYLNFPVLSSIQAILKTPFLIRNLAIVVLSNHVMFYLFSQLGMNNVQVDITSFIETHKGIPAELPLY